MRGKTKRKNNDIVYRTRSERNDHDTVTSDEWGLKAVIIGAY